MAEKKPKLMVFDLDYTLWPFWVDTHVTPPFHKGKNGSIVDAHGQKIRYYENVPEILKDLNEQGYEIGVASRTSEIKGAHQLLNLFGWDKHIKYKEIYPGCKVTHFNKSIYLEIMKFVFFSAENRIREASGVEFKDMIFFDDEQRNIRDLTAIGVLSILVKNGVTRKVIKEALEKFSTR